MPSTGWVVSVKGVVRRSDEVLLAYNDRDEWELPGGQLEAGETLEHCVEREIHEETGLSVTASHLLRSWVYEVIAGRSVVIITYQFHLTRPEQTPITSHEHSRVAFIPLDQLDAINLPSPYRAAIEASTTPPPDALGQRGRRQAPR